MRYILMDTFLCYTIFYLESVTDKEDVAVLGSKGETVLILSREGQFTSMTQYKE